jgi:hypothetical protein
MNKTIHMTFRNHNFPKEKVFNRWLDLNPDWKIEFSDDTDCLRFIIQHFGQDYAHLFRQVRCGANRSDVWRLCKLYVEGGVYADIDLIPYVPIEQMIGDSDFCTCMSIVEGSIFQAFIYVEKENIIIKECLQSLLDNKYNYKWTTAEPTFDMYNTMVRMGLDLKVGTFDYNDMKIRILEEYIPDMTWENCLMVTSGDETWAPRVRLNDIDVMRSKDLDYERAKINNKTWI